MRLTSVAGLAPCIPVLAWSRFKRVNQAIGKGQIDQKRRTTRLLCMLDRRGKDSQQTQQAIIPNHLAGMLLISNETQNGHTIKFVNPAELTGFLYNNSN